MKTIYLHIGYHKTATTFLQNLIYPHLKHVNYIDKNTFRETFRQLRLQRKISDARIAEIRREIEGFDNGQPMLISNESLSGSPFSPKKTKSQAKILKDLRRLFPEEAYDVHVIVGIREQVSLLTSLYIQHIHQGGVLSGPDYIKYCEHNGSIENYYFDRYLDKIDAVFGTDRLYVMLFEDFKRDAEGEMLKLLNYMGEPEVPAYRNEAKWQNKSLGKAQAAIVRRMNRLFRSPIHPDGPLPIVRLPIVGALKPTRFLQNPVSFALHYKKYEFPEDLQASLKERYAASNKKLAASRGLDLPDKYF